MSLIDRIDALLPQTQCQRCQYDGCRPYAEAIAAGDAINKCPPGGDTTVAALATLLDRSPLPLDPAHGAPGPRLVAMIDEGACIGCTKCIQVCPTDAILGAARQMHTVIETECTGCELCLPACPVDCIDMQQPRHSSSEINTRQSSAWRQRYQQRQQRLAALQAARRQRRQERIPSLSNPPVKSRTELQRDILAAVARAKARRQQR